MSVQKEEPNILDNPLHGIFIPSGLLLLGIAVTTYQSGEKRLLLVIPLALAFLLHRAYGAHKRRVSITPDKWSALELEDQTVVSKNTAIYRFKLKTSFETLDLPPGRHLAVKIPIDGADEIRFYTPISPRFAQGYFDLLVKSYADGKVSKYFAGLRQGQTVEFRGPVGTFNYEANTTKVIGIVAGGSGITPILQVLNEVITVPEDLTKISLIYANETPNDILLKDELDEMAEKYPNFEVHYTVRKPNDKWEGPIGQVTEEMMRACLPGPAEDHRLLICGPEGMNKAVTQYAVNLGWKFSGQDCKGDDQVFVF
ncbi:hypothetical protein HG536_0H00310 [Torulaspora globosa]|uniref:NADH-cytochrome b5 reductase n=1 Tax=Torulaspora globosa TaxID=48254 RepID=A0A7G3ZMC1_9SACH|nr:uncharacterized protein HG536_0H00310 [Torulaspora globosa]QLL34657.1 hypothetical protein HG536_0H00310 [Torulaspora globosa]